MNYLIKEPKTTNGSNKAIILLHGVGSNEQDLFGLTEYLPEDYYIISVQAPYSLGQERYAWYQVNFINGKPVFDQEQEKVSREKLIGFVSGIKRKFNLKQVYLGGFSQGAIMSFSVGLSVPQEVAGIIGFSGRILEEIQSEVKSGNGLDKLRIFLAHGVQDGTLSVGFAREAKKFLENLGINLTYHEYQIGHQITTEVLKDLNVWLDK